MNNFHSQLSGWIRLIFSRSLYIFFLLVVGTSCSKTETPIAPDAETVSPPNIVIILADDMGMGDVGAYNAASKVPTPGLDTLAASGMRFTDAHSPSSVCTPTRYALLTGRYAWRSSLKKGVLKGYDPLLIDPARRTIATMLHEQGYATAAIGKWHLGLGDQEVTDYSKPLTPGPNDVGFDYFFGIPASLDFAPYTFVEDNRVYTSFDGDEVDDSERRRYGGEGFWRAGPIARDFAHIDVLPQIMEHSVDYIRDQANSDSDQPFFLYVPLSAPHTPWMPTPEFIGRSEAGYYGDFVAQVDHTVKQIINALEETGVSDNTIVVFTSDNGARWLPEDNEQWGHRANMGNRGQKADIHEGGHRIPMIVSWPGKISPDTETGHLTTLADLYATIADVAGVEPGPEDGEDSESVLPTLLGEGQAQRAFVVHHSARGMFALRAGDWKLIEGLGSGGFTKPAVIEPEEGGPAGQLYNLAEDPTEETNLYLERPDVVENLTLILQETRGTDSGPL
ncbi:MAG: arylsulfatase [Gammaproteobacteria bacterium]|nr:arylsulfatase [Gammaproteobacteria bacterium]